MNKFIYTVTLFLFGATLMAQEVEFTPDTTRFVIGEQINFKLKAKSDKNTTIDWPVLNDTIGELEVITRSKIDTTFKGDLQIIEQNYKLTHFDSGSYVLNPVRFKIGDSILYTKPKMIEVYSVAVDTTKQKLYPIKSNIEVGYSFREILPYILIWLFLMLLVFGGIYFFKKHQAKEKVVEEIKIPPFDSAMMGLKELDKEDLINKGEIKEFYVRLTDILRRFIEDEHKIPAMESTTDEIMEGIKYLNLSKDTNSKIDELLVESDYVKFAKYKPKLGRNLHFRESTEAIIKETRLSIEEEKEDE